MSVPIYKQIKNDLFRQIASGQLREGDRIPSESDIRKQYYVSAITAKNALNMLVDEGVATRIKGKGTFVCSSPYSVPALQNQHREIIIGTVFPYTIHYNTTHYIHYLDEYCQQHNCGLYIRYSRESHEMETDILKRFIRDGVSGILLLPAVAEQSNPFVTQLIENQFPLVFLDRFLPGLDCSYVISDNTAGAQVAAKYLLNTVGRNIAALHFPAWNNTVIDRLKGFANAFAAAGEPLDEINFCEINDLELLDQDNTKRVPYFLSAITEFLRRHGDIRGLFAVNTEIAQVAYYAVIRLGFTPGEDFQMVCFDNPYLPGVNFIQQNNRDMAESAMELLRKQTAGDFTPVHRVVPVRFLPGETVGKDPTALQYLIRSQLPET